MSSDQRIADLENECTGSEEQVRRHSDDQRLTTRLSTPLLPAMAVLCCAGYCCSPLAMALSLFGAVYCLPICLIPDFSLKLELCKQMHQKVENRLSIQLNTTRFNSIHILQIIPNTLY